MSYKILFATDLHMRATRPVSRLDKDYLDTLLGKIDQIATISSSADLAILGGDIFDRPDAPHSLTIKVNRAFAKFKCPVYTIIGNHDIYGYEGLTVEATAMGSLFEMGKVKRLDFLELRKTGEKPVHIYGMHAFDKEEWTVPPADAAKILVVHKQMTDKPFPGGKCILLDDVAKVTNADLILSGDIHYPHHSKIGNHLFVNPGAMSRGSIADKDRFPQVAVVVVGAEGVASEFQTLETRPAELLFDLTGYSNRMASESHTDEFRTYVNAVISIKSTTEKIGDVLISFFEKNNVADKMRQISREYLARAEKEVLQETHE